MNASKENAREAHHRLFAESTKPQTTLLLVDWQFLSDFLTAAEKRLPSEATIAKDKTRRRKKKVDTTKLGSAESL